MGRLPFPFLSLLFALFLSFLPSVAAIPCSTYRPAPTGISLLTSSSTGDCVTSLDSDFAGRDSWALNGNGYSPCTVVDTWGPYPKLYARATIPSNCPSVAWQQQRILKAIDWLIKKGWNYCHHHSPYWLPPDDGTSRVGISPNDVAALGTAGTCSSSAWPDGVADPSKDAHWTGVDCTHFTSYVYNFAFGGYLITNTGDQACSTSNPGKLLSLTAAQADQFLPGDILYIGSSSTANPMTISHGILWTGYKMDDPSYPQFSKANLLANMAEGQRNSTIKWLKQNPSKTVYVLADSHFTGPNYRPFAGWYYTAFSHARRVINPPLTDSFPSGRTMVYTNMGGTCSVQKTTRRKKREFKPPVHSNHHQNEAHLNRGHYQQDDDLRSHHHQNDDLRSHHHQNDGHLKSHHHQDDAHLRKRHH